MPPSSISGCGSGALLFVLGRAGNRNIAGVDVSEEQIARSFAQRLWHRRGRVCHPGRLSRCTASTLGPTPILAMGSIGHLSRRHGSPWPLSAESSSRAAASPTSPTQKASSALPSAMVISPMRLPSPASPRHRSSVKFAGFNEVRCFEDKPRVHGLKSLVRRITGTPGAVRSRLLHLSETGAPGAILSQNMLIEARFNGTGRGFGHPNRLQRATPPTNRHLV